MMKAGYVFYNLHHRHYPYPRVLTRKCESKAHGPSPGFYEPHICANPGHLEYKINVETPSSTVPDYKPTLAFDDAENH
jgi:hypothetical protein